MYKCVIRKQNKIEMYSLSLAIFVFISRNSSMKEAAAKFLLSTVFIFLFITIHLILHYLVQSVFIEREGMRE